MAGYAGSPRRSVFVSVGAASLRAAHLAELGAAGGEAVLIDGATRAALADRIDSAALPPVRLPGDSKRRTDLRTGSDMSMRAAYLPTFTGAIATCTMVCAAATMSACLICAIKTLRCGSLMEMTELNSVTVVATARTAETTRPVMLRGCIGRVLRIRFFMFRFLEGCVVIDGSTIAPGPLCSPLAV